MQQRQTHLPLVTGVLQRKSAWPQRSLTLDNDPSAVPSIVPEVLRTQGEPLDWTTRAFMEPRFGYDFSHLRVHTDQLAAASADAVNAAAYTVGNHLVFAQGQYAPGTSAGRRLLSHELTHSVQQSAAVSESPASSIQIGRPDSAAEIQADSVSHIIESGANVADFSGVGQVLQRQPARPPQNSRPEDFGITLAVVDHGATSVVGQARERLNEIFRTLSPTNLTVMQSSGITRIELHIIPYNQRIIDLPDFAHMRGTSTPDNRLWDNIRGSGGERFGSTIKYSIGEENLAGGRHGHGAAIGFGIGGGLLVGAGGAALGEHIGSKLQTGSGPGGIIGGIVGGVAGAALGAVGGAFLGDLLDESSASEYGRNFLGGHEGSHVIENFALTAAQHTRLEALYAARRAAGGPWLEPTGYTSSNIDEYWAQCAAAYFSRPYHSAYESMYTPEWLRRNDPGMYQLLREVFGAIPGATASADVPRQAAA